MTVETATYISELNAVNPAAGDIQTEGDNHFRLMKTVLQATFPNASKAFYFPGYLAKSIDYTVLAADMSKTIGVDSTAAARTQTLPTLVSGDAGWTITVQKIDASANAVNVASASLINGATPLVLSAQWDSAILRWTGTTWYAIVTSGAVDISSVALTALDITGGTALTAIAVGDYIPVYDASAGANRKITALDFLDIINALTEDAAPDSANDFLSSWDTSAAEAKKIKISTIVTTIVAAAAVPAAATQAQMEAASVTTAYVSPGRVKNHPGVAKVVGQVVFTAPSTVTLQSGSFGITSVARPSAGRLTVTFSTAFADTKYVAQVAVERTTTAQTDNNDKLHCNVRNGTVATGSVGFEAWDGSDAADFTDPDRWFIVIFGDHA